MFSDLVGSTALAARMDPEDLREAIPAHQKCVAETVRRFGGFVAKYLGDGVLIYFAALIPFSAKRRAYSDMPSFPSQSAISCIAAPCPAVSGIWTCRRGNFS